VQYTRNMVTGASTADLGLVLVDARQGPHRAVPPPRGDPVRCCGCPHLVLAVNKMDLVDYDQRSTTDPQGVHLLRDQAEHPDLEVIPISALKGDNVVHRSENMPWYNGSSLMHHLENVHVASDRDLVDTRLPGAVRRAPQVRRVPRLPRLRRPGRRRRAQAGDEVVVLPSGMTSKIAGIDLFDKEIDEAFPPMSVTVRLEDDVDVSRGDMIARSRTPRSRARTSTR
jgi:bifunctional enzyme CysN/CysC/sulfate adenylyltransferase subunit 1